MDYSKEEIINLLRRTSDFLKEDKEDVTILTQKDFVILYIDNIADKSYEIMITTKST